MADQHDHRKPRRQRGDRHAQAIALGNHRQHRGERRKQQGLQKQHRAIGACLLRQPAQGGQRAAVQQAATDTRHQPAGQQASEALRLHAAQVGGQAQQGTAQGQQAGADAAFGRRAEQRADDDAGHFHRQHPALLLQRQVELAREHAEKHRADADDHGRGDGDIDEQSAGHKTCACFHGGVFQATRPAGGRGGVRGRCGRCGRSSWSAPLRSCRCRACSARTGHARG